MVNCIPNEGARLSEQHRGLVKMPCGDTPDDRGVSTGTANTRTIITASWPPSLHLAHPADPCAPGSFHSHSSAASPSYVCKQPHASLTLSGLPFNGVGRASPAPVQWIDDARVPHPVRWIRTHKSCSLFNGLGCTSPVLFPGSMGQDAPVPSRFLSTGLGHMGLASCSAIENARVPLPVQWIRAHRSCFPFSGLGGTSPVLFPGSMGQDAPVPSCFLSMGLGRTDPASCSAIENARVPLPVQWTRAHRSCFPFSGLGRTSPVPFPDRWSERTSYVLFLVRWVKVQSPSPCSAE